MKTSEMTYREILNTYDFTHKFYVKYALSCAKYAISFDKKPNIEVKEAYTKAINLTEAWLKGEPVSAEELKAAAADATNAATTYATTNAYAYAAARSTYAYASATSATTYAAAYATTNAYASATYAYAAAASAAYATTYAAAAAAAAAALADAAAASAARSTYATSEVYLRDMLISMIKEEHSRLELILLGLQDLI